VIVMEFLISCGTRQFVTILAKAPVMELCRRTLCSPYLPNQFINILCSFQYYPPIYDYVYKVASCFRVFFRLQYGMHFLRRRPPRHYMFHKTQPPWFNNAKIIKFLIVYSASTSCYFPSPVNKRSSKIPPHS
jgi:hypothetical protein